MSRNAQLQNLLAKEEQRLEQEQKRAAVERRRKQQQEKFQLQHDLNHPLRYHHMQQRGSTPKGIETLEPLYLDCHSSVASPQCTYHAMCFGNRFA